MVRRDNDFDESSHSSGTVPRLGQLRRYLDWNNMRYSCKRLLILFTVISIAIFLVALPFVHQQRMIFRGVSSADESWATNAVIFEWPTPESTISGLRIWHHVDRDSGLMIQTRAPSDFCDAYNSEIRNLLHEHGAPQYSLTDVLPTDAEIGNTFLSGNMKPIANFPTKLTESIRLNVDGSLHIETTGTEFTKGMSMCVDYKNSVYTFDDGTLIYVRSGNHWMGVFHYDGRLLFTVN